MKQLWCAMSLMAGSLLFSVNASADTSSGALLQQMNLASQSLNYELSFVSISKQGVESLRYRHARLNNQPLAQLLQLDGPRREVVLRGTEISYFEPGLDPFTLNGDYIVDSLPSLVYSDFKRLSAAYDFISVGRTRIADRLCDVIRVVARDGTRYSFIAWLDAETKLPLRVDLLDRDGETLEQFRVVSFNVGDNVSASMETLAKANLPPQLSVPEGGDKANFNWAPTWLPQGVTTCLPYILKETDMSLLNVPAGKDLPEDIYVVIEIPANADPIKYEVDKESGALFVDRFMSTAMFYPCNYGYINHTLSLDGDPVDVLVPTPYPLQPGSVIRCRPVGVLKMTDESGEDAKLVAVPHTKLSKEYDHINDVNDLPELLKAQITHFFEHYKDLEKGKWVKVDGWDNAEAAKAEIVASFERAKQK